MTAWTRLALGVFCLAFCATGGWNSLGAQEVALTFDDLPSHGVLPPGRTRVDIAGAIVDALRESAAPNPYGFINAKKLEGDPSGVEVLKLWRAAGFPLGSHSFSHMNLHANSVKAFELDVARNEPALQSLMGEDDWRWFRYPYLREGDSLEKLRAVRAYLNASGYRIARASLDFEDYAWNAPYARCTQQDDAAAIEWLEASYLETASEYIELGRSMARIIYGRDIKHVMVLHVGGFNARMLPDLLRLLRQRGFKLITLEEADADPAYRSAPELPLERGLTLLEQMMLAKSLAVPAHNEKPFEKLNAICR